MNHSVLGCTALLSWAALASPLQAQTPRPMTVDDAMDMVAVSNPLIAPDGSWVLFSRRTLNWDDNKYETEVHRVSADGGESFQYISDDGGSNYQFSPDGAYLTFRRKAGEGDSAKQQVHWMRTAGGEATALTEHKTDIASFRWSPDGTRIFFSAVDARPDSVEKEIKKGDDAIFVDEGPNGQRSANWSNLWVFDLESKTERQLTDAEHILGAWDVSPDGRQIAFSARETNRRNDGYKNELYLLDVASGGIRQLTENDAPEGSPLWAPDNRTLLFMAADDEEWVNRNSKLWLLDTRDGSARLLTDGFEGSPGDPAWALDGQSVLFSGQVGTDTNLYRVHVADGRVEQLTDRTGTLNVGSYSADRSRVAYVFSDFDTPPDLWVADVAGGEPTRLTHANPQVESLLLAEMQLVQWTSAGGMEIEGLLHTPPGRADGERVPLMLNIHGGPAGVFANSWQPRYHIYAGLGYASCPRTSAAAAPIRTNCERATPSRRATASERATTRISSRAWIT